jgi:hypothetical protein
MSAVAAPVAAPVEAGSSLRQLARIEAKRYARHPVFLIGFALALVFSATENGPIELDYHVIPSFFIGVLGIVVAARLTTSTEQAQPIVGSAPVSQTTRTSALCIACAVPTIAGLAVVLLHRAVVLADPIPAWMYGTYGSTDRFLISIVIPVIACAGGPLLGVAVGRWLHFPGAALLSVIVVLFWGNISGYLTTQKWESDAFGARLLHMGAPYTAFATSDSEGSAPTLITSYTGSPFWYAVWTVCLCGLAVAAALWSGAEGSMRHRVARGFVVLGALALFSLGLSVVTGNQHLYETTSHHTVQVSGAAPHPAGR